MSVDKAVLDGLVAEVKVLWKEAEKAHGFWACLKALPSLAPAAVKIVEDASIKLNLKGADKKQLALDIVFAYVHLPWYAPESFVRLLAGRAIEAAVARLP